MSTEMRNLSESRRAVVRAALEFGDRIAEIRRRLELARGIDPNSSDFNSLISEQTAEPTAPDTAQD